MRLNHSKIQEVINKLCLMKVELANLDTMFIAYRLDRALKEIGNDYAELCLSEETTLIAENEDTFGEIQEH